MTTQNELRLLPWSGTEGNPCYLSTEDGSGYLSRLADNTEAAQLEKSGELLEHALEVLGDGEAEPNEVRRLAMVMTEALRAVRRVGISRGHRLPVTDFAACDRGDDDPRLPTAAFG
ncbi:hypothetical protein [Streptomyces tubercidicus]|uniref:hypothetical protein n=1 Tax=Streptomyces tubercidicus TaxID=47759 RepID=UPI003467AFCC